MEWMLARCVSVNKVLSVCGVKTRKERKREKGGSVGEERGEVYGFFRAALSLSGCSNVNLNGDGNE